MNIYKVKLGIVVLSCLLFLGGCAGKPPTIAHTHVGHAMTGWSDTPGQKGLFVTAEKAAQEALKAATSAADSSSSLAAIKADVNRVITATHSDGKPVEGDETVVQYGVYNALAGAVDHIAFAAESPDASENIKSSTETFSRHAQVVLDRCDLVLALGGEILATPSHDEAELLVTELQRLAEANVTGEDIDGDGVVGTISAEYGLKQLRTQLQAMIDREKPPYMTVDTYYLFNLVRLPNGDWAFLSPSERGSKRGYGRYRR